ncbi:MAG: hypothetical protein ACRDP4_07555 [Nocardioidaceae bacterium]
MSKLLRLALDRHGGHERWEHLHSITATATAGGALFASKGRPHGLGTVHAVADVTAPRLTYTPFQRAARGVFEPEHVSLIRKDGTEHHRDNPRETFANLTPDSAWDDLHLLYFTGCAMWNYLCAPFYLTWPGVDTDEIEPWTERDQTWRRLRVTFPRHMPTHGREQVFYFDETGLLRRLDYAPEVLGSPVVAHYCDDYQIFSGLLMPTRRRVYLRRDDGSPDLDVTVVELDIENILITPPEGTPTSIPSR